MTVIQKGNKNKCSNYKVIFVTNKEGEYMEEYPKASR